MSKNVLIPTEIYLDGEYIMLALDEGIPLVSVIGREDMCSSHTDILARSYPLAQVPFTRKALIALVDDYSVDVRHALLNLVDWYAMGIDVKEVRVYQDSAIRRFCDHFTPYRDIVLSTFSGDEHKQTKKYLHHAYANDDYVYPWTLDRRTTLWKLYREYQVNNINAYMDALEKYTKRGEL